MKSSRLKPLIFLAIPLAVGGLAALFSAGSMDKFSALNQPPLSPPGWLFPIVWGILYAPDDIYSHGHGIVYSLQLGCAGDKQAESTRTLSRPARVQFSLADTVFHFRALYRCGGSYRYSLGSHSFDVSVFLQDIKNRRLSDYPVSFMGDIRGVSQHRDMHYKLKIHLPQTFVSHAGGVDFIRNISADNHREPR